MSSPAKIVFDQLKSDSHSKLKHDHEFRSRVIRDVISYLKTSAQEFQHPWNQFEVPHDLSLCIQYTDERRGHPLIRTITDLLIENLLGTIDVAIISRDEDNPVFTEQSPATRKVFRVFQSAGGHFIALNTEWLSDFYALLELRKLAYENQQLLIANDAAVEIDFEDYRNFLASEFESGLITALAGAIEMALAERRDDQTDDGESKPVSDEAIESAEAVQPAS